MSDVVATCAMDLMPAQVWQRVMRFRGETGRPGTAFLCTIEDRDLLVTAEHLCGPDADEVVTLQHPWTHGANPLQTMLARVGSHNYVGDVAASDVSGLEFNAVVGVVPLTSQDLAFTQDVFILGYPYGLSFQMQGGELPLVKRGIVSGSRHGDGGEELFVVDTIANPGFSGGPIVFFPHGSTDPRFAGVVTQNITAPVVEPTAEDPNPPYVNAGVSLATNMASVTALLD